MIPWAMVFVVERKGPWDSERNIVYHMKIVSYSAMYHTKIFYWCGTPQENIIWDTIREGKFPLSQEKNVC